MKTVLLFSIIICFLLIANSAAASMLKINDSAPEFSLADQNGNTVNLSDFKGQKFVVLIFYPGDQTPVCTQQLCEIRDNYSDFNKYETVVFGINPASDKSHKKFAEKNNLPFPLLIDSKLKTASQYHAKGLFMNKRTVYVINKDGKIIFAKRGKPSVSEIMNSIVSSGNSIQIDIKK